MKGRAMLKRRHITGLLQGAMTILIILGCNTKKDLYTLELNNLDDTKQFFQYIGQDLPLISAHRGGAIIGFPENSIAVLEHTLHHTTAVFEVDPRLTKDSVIVLMHDATLDRTTNGTGKVSGYSWEELKLLKLKDPQGNVTDHRIPTLDEVIEWSRGKTVINLDKKDVPLEMTAQKIRETNSAVHVIITVHNAREAKYYYEKNNDFLFSAWVKTKKAFEEYNEAIPWGQVMMAYIGPEVTPENRELIDLLHERNVMVMVGTAPSYDKLEPEQRKKAYRKLIETGIDIIETDRPVEVAETIYSSLPAR